ncbi:DUF4422 domain-containing protein [Microbacterium sediminis]|uniref:DUF4422 domain-containing protein n=1 Tax=Microbacterium sediminis TaxID=904291 RepID=UPI000A47769F|nr:DUF4422 domain-containing protein [Microbacterium sediminis]
MSLRVFVAAHKPYDMPDDGVYEPIHVGHANATVKTGFTADDTGDNISARNASYCELTGLYWFWRNTNHDAYGLAHYRRYFAGSGWRGVATGEEMRDWLNAADVIVPRRRNYVIETVRSQYTRAHHGSDLDAARTAIAELSPDYLLAFDRVMARRTLSLYNMFLMRRELLDDYAKWVFTILERASRDIDVSSYGPQQKRVFGYLGERLFNVWLEKNADRLKVQRRRIVALEGENLVKKAWGLINRRFGRGRAH